MAVQGRPKGREPKLSLKPCAEWLRTQGMPVRAAFMTEPRDR